MQSCATVLALGVRQELPVVRQTEEKMAALRRYREGQYEKLKDAVYERRGWTKDGIPKLEKVQELGIDFPDVTELIRRNGM